MMTFLIVMLIIAGLASFFWLFSKVADIKYQTLQEAEMKALTEVKKALQEQKDKTSQEDEPATPPPPSKPEIKQDTDSGISYE